MRRLKEFLKSMIEMYAFDELNLLMILNDIYKDRKEIKSGLIVSALSYLRRGFPHLPQKNLSG